MRKLYYIFLILLFCSVANAAIEVTGTFDQKGGGDGFAIVDGEDIDDSTSTSGNILTSDGDLFGSVTMGGDCTIIADGTITCAAGGMTSFIAEDGDGTEVSISDAEEWKFVEGTGIDINWTDVTPGSDADPFDLTFTIDATCAEITSCVDNAWDALTDMALTDTYIYVGNGSADPVGVDLTGHVSITNLGVATVSDMTCTNCIGDTEITTHAGTSLAADLEEEVTAGSLADNTIDSDDFVHEDWGEVTNASGSVVIDDSIAVTSWNLTTPTITTSIDLPAGAINTATEIVGDLLTHTQIHDSDQTDTKCIWFENPVATDDFKSIWANKTANVFTLTELWCESDQTVTMMLQVDDGTPADLDTVDLICNSSEDDDTALNGDTEIAAGEELDLTTISVASTPTWVSICWTGNWKD